MIEATTTLTRAAVHERDERDEADHGHGTGQERVVRIDRGDAGRVARLSMEIDQQCQQAADHCAAQCPQGGEQ